MTKSDPNRWDEEKFRVIVSSSKTVSEAIRRLGLKPAGGNYAQFYFYVHRYNVKIDHFAGQSWRKGQSIPRSPVYSLEELLVRNRKTALHNLKRRLFEAGLKEPSCEECGWCERSPDGRLPIELDHINGDNTDNRLSNLRILCPNCHSLKPTHRGSNMRFRSRGGGIGYTRGS